MNLQFNRRDVARESAIVMHMFDMLPETSNLGEYADRCLARPRYAMAVEKSSG